jgi:hypothetical protein
MAIFRRPHDSVRTERCYSISLVRGTGPSVLDAFVRQTTGLQFVQRPPGIILAIDESKRLLVRVPESFQERRGSAFHALSARRLSPSQTKASAVVSFGRGWFFYALG